MQCTRVVLVLDYVGLYEKGGFKVDHTTKWVKRDTSLTPESSTTIRFHSMSRSNSISLVYADFNDVLVDSIEDAQPMKEWSEDCRVF